MNAATLPQRSPTLASLLGIRGSVTRVTGRSARFAIIAAVVQDRTPHEAIALRGGSRAIWRARSVWIVRRGSVGIAHLVASAASSGTPCRGAEPGARFGGVRRSARTGDPARPDHGHRLLDFLIAVAALPLRP